MRGWGGRVAAPMGCALALMLLLGCAGAPPGAAEQEGAQAASAGEVPDTVRADSAPIPAGSGEAQDSLTFTERVVVFVLGTPEELEAMRARHGEEDFHVVADDAMWYRATAYEYLEQRGVPVETIRGRRPLYFLVDGEIRRFDLPDESAFDVVVLYDTNREPCIIAPVEVDFLAEGYFDGTRAADEMGRCRSSAGGGMEGKGDA